MTLGFSTFYWKILKRWNVSDKAYWLWCHQRAEKWKASTSWLGFQSGFKLDFLRLLDYPLSPHLYKVVRPFIYLKYFLVLTFRISPTSINGLIQRYVEGFKKVVQVFSDLEFSFDLISVLMICFILFLWLNFCFENLLNSLIHLRLWLIFLLTGFPTENGLIVEHTSLMPAFWLSGS